MNLDQLSYALECAKQHENEARENRLRAEDALIAAVGLKDEGTNSVKSDWYKISVTQTLDRKFVPDFASILNTLDPAIVEQLVRIKTELNVTALKTLATANPEAFRVAASAVITKPAKPSVKIERIEKEAA
jgi:hypothetical protein